MLHGMVFKKETEGDITSVKDAKIAVFSCPFDCMVTETKVEKCLLKPASFMYFNVKPYVMYLYCIGFNICFHYLRIFCNKQNGMHIAAIKQIVGT